MFTATVGLAGFLSLAGPLGAQSSSAKPSATTAKKSAPSSQPGAKAKPKQPAAPASIVELNRRLVAAMSAQQGGDLDAVIRANRILLGQALREMADLRVIENAVPQSAELFKQSLEFEDDASAHLGLSVAFLRLKQPTAALAEADKVTTADPKNALAWNVKGKARMMQKDYRAAAQSLAHAIALKGDMEAAYSLATCLLALKEKDRAAMVFQDMVTVSGGDRPSLHILFGRAYRDASLLDDAIREFRKALALDPKTPHAHYFIGLIRLIENEWAPLPEIRQEMQLELRYHPRDFLANYVLGVFTSTDKEYEASNRYLRTSAEVQAKSPEPWLYLGLNEYSRGNLKIAEEYLRRAVEFTGSEESRSHYQIRKAYIALGRILIQTGRKEEAAPWMAKARAVQALGLVESQQTIAEVFSDSGIGMGAVMPYVSPESEEKAVSTKLVDATAPLEQSDIAKAALDTTEAKAAAQQEKQLREILGTAYNDLGTAEARHKDYARAEIHFKEAEKWNAEIPGLMRNLGLAASRMNDHPTVVRVFSKQMQADPQDQVVRALLGISYFMTEKFADAAAAIEPLGEAAAGDPALAYPWAASLMRTGKLKESAAVVERLEREKIPIDSLLLLAQLWNDLGEPQHAVQDYRRALEADPSLHGAHYLAGLTLLRTGKPEEASVEFEAELAIDPQNTNARYNLGFVYQQESKPDLAKAQFEAVLAQDPKHSNAQYQLGKLLLDQGKVKEAIEHLEAAARLTPEIDYIHYQLQAAYRKDDRIADAEREMQIYKEAKAKNRDKELPQPTPKQ